MPVETIAAAHYRRQVVLARRAATALARIWGRVATSSIGPSWADQVTEAADVLRSAQAIAAAASAVYIDDMSTEYGNHDVPGGRVIPGAFAETAADGRELASLLYHPAVVALTAIRNGAPPRRALAAGGLSLDMIARTEVADAGRVADGVAITARRSMTGYVRMTVGKTCSRCLILAGKRYRWNQGFQRHPRCDCRHIPVAEDVPGDVRTDPKAAFKSMSPDEQDRVFTRDGARAIRDGADMGQVVNARKGMYTAAGQRRTSQGAGRRRGRPPRLMPEQIYREAKGNRDEAIRLLRLHGYLI